MKTHYSEYTSYLEIYACLTNAENSDAAKQQ